jgi:hypothetical protein
MVFVAFRPLAPVVRQPASPLHHRHHVHLVCMTVVECNAGFVRLTLLMMHRARCRPDSVRPVDN